MLVQQKQVGLFQGGHQKGQSLTLAAGQKTHLGSEPVFQTQIQNFQLLHIGLPLGTGDTGPEGSGHSPAGGQSQILLDLHGGGGTHHGILEDPADELSPLVFGQAGHVVAADGNGSGIHPPDACHGVEHGGLARTVAADDGDEIPFGKMEIQPPQGNLFVDGSGIEGFGHIFDFQHNCVLLTWMPWQASAGSSNREPPGRRPRSERKSASDSWSQSSAG